MNLAGIDVLGDDAGGYDLAGVQRQLNEVFAHREGDKLVDNQISADTGKRLVEVGQKAVDAAYRTALRRATSTLVPGDTMTSSVDAVRTMLIADAANVEIWCALGPTLPKNVADQIRTDVTKAMVEANAQLAGAEWVSERVSLFREIWQAIKNLPKNLENAPSLIPSWVYYLAGGVAVAVGVGVVGVYAMPLLLARRAAR